MIKKNSFWILVILVLGACLLFLEENPYTEETLSFDNKSDRLGGSLILPRDKPGKLPCILFVHGSQSMPRDSFGYLKPYWSAFAEAGYACLSWDKPGVGQSSGDWHHQTMTDRAEEVLAAVTYLKTRQEIDENRLGLIGFSQGGWVLALAASMSRDIRFIIPVSGAVDWVSQEKLVLKNMLEDQALSKEEIETALCFRDQTNGLLRQKASYDRYLDLIRTRAPQSFSGPVTRADWHFFKLNVHTCVTQSLPLVKCPVLALFGGNDAYVDVQKSMEVYESELRAAGNTDVTIRLFPRADHSMLQSRTKHFVHKGLPMVINVLKWELLGKDAFPPDYFSTITDWLDSPGRIRDL